MVSKIVKYVCYFMCFVVCFAFFNNCSEKCCVTKCSALKASTTAKAMATIEKDSGRLLYSSNENERLPMASLTKIITAFYVLEHNKNIDEIIEIPKFAVGIEGTSIGLKHGEHLTVKELLYGLMLRSGNDAAVALAYATSGSEDQFVNDVNLWLHDLGFINTSIKNPHGLHSEGHFTTAYELAKITALALNNTVFQEIVSTKEKTISNELNSKISRRLKNKNRFLNEFEFADGVKTGYTSKAGRCFVGSATKNDMQVICVLLNCVPMFEECEALIKKAFDEFKLKKIVSKGDSLGFVDINKSKEKRLEILINEDFYYPLKQNEFENIKLCFKEKENLMAPIEFGEELGIVEISFKNQLIFSDKIYSIKYIKSNTLCSEFKRIIDKMWLGGRNYEN